VFPAFPNPLTSKWQRPGHLRTPVGGLASASSNSERAAPGRAKRTHAWANQYGKLRWCTERRRVVVEFWLALANAVIVCGRLVRRAWTCYRWDSRPRRRP
jgi:hypothetical protein